MPRGKRAVFSGTCKDCTKRTVTVRLHRQDKKGRAWKEVIKDLKKYCPTCRKRTEVKFKEERHGT